MEDVEISKNEPNSEQSDQRRDSHQAQSCPPIYLKTPAGILKIIEMVLCLITFGCSLGGQWSTQGGGWVEFVAMASFTVSAMWFMMHLVNSVPRRLLMRPWEFVSCVVVAILFFVSAILCAVKAQSYEVNRGAVGSASFFSFANVAVYGMVDAYFQIYNWRTLVTMSSVVQRSISAVPSGNAQPLQANL